MGHTWGDDTEVDGSGTHRRGGGGPRGRRRAAGRERASRDTSVLEGVQRVQRRFGDDDLERVAAHDARAVLGRDPRHPGSRWRTCARKVAYGERSAHRAARQLRDAQHEDLHAYPCPYCRRWHVGHLPIARPSSWSAVTDADGVGRVSGGGRRLGPRPVDARSGHSWWSTRA